MLRAEYEAPKRPSQPIARTARCQRARVGKAERRQHRPPETGNRGVIASHGLMVKISNSRRVRVVSDRVQRATRQIEKQVVVRLVEKSYRIASQVICTSKVRPRRSATVAIVGTNSGGAQRSTPEGSAEPGTLPPLAKG
jgi:hypothetical protein